MKIAFSERFLIKKKKEMNETNFFFFFVTIKRIEK